jgi:hypothetical protein
VTISAHATRFAGLPVRDYAPGRGLTSPSRTAYRIRLDYDSEESFDSLFGSLVDSPGANELAAIVIGAWSNEMYDDTTATLVEALVGARDKLSKLKGIFLGDITSEENEISWIKQSDVSPLLAAYPKLEHLQVRGGEGLSLGKLDHAHLKSLVVEAGGLPATVVREVGAARLPALEHLELWLGEDNYGGNTKVDDLRPILSGGLFPRLRSLGLRDSEIADEVAAAAALAPVLRQIKVLDLSLGNLSDVGAEALLASPAVARLEKLDIHYHFVSKELVDRLAALGVEVDASQRQKPDDWGDGELHRYIAVSE